MVIRDLVHRIERLDVLDPVGDWLGGALAPLLSGRLKDVLSGSWLGHPLHPVLTDLPIGALTASTLVDVLGGAEGGSVADTLTLIGLASVAPTALAGLSDWTDTVGEERRLGLIHALANAGSSALYAAAFLSRRGGSRGASRLFSLAGLAVLSASGYIGGHLVLARGIGVDHTVFDEAPSDWTAVADETELGEDTPHVADAGGYAVFLYRHAGTVYALADRCTHAGGPLHEGEVDADLCVTCPWHGSAFRLADGSVVRGPASAPEPAFDTRVNDGRVEVRLRAR